MILQVRTKSGVVTSLNCVEVISIDDIPYSELFSGPQVSLDNVNDRVTLIESTLAEMARQWNEFMSTAVPVGTSPNEKEEE